MATTPEHTAWHLIDTPFRKGGASEMSRARADLVWQRIHIHLVGQHNNHTDSHKKPQPATHLRETCHELPRRIATRRFPGSSLLENVLANYYTRGERGGKHHPALGLHLQHKHCFSTGSATAIEAAGLGSGVGGVEHTRRFVSSSSPSPAIPLDREKEGRTWNGTPE